MIFNYANGLLYISDPPQWWWDIMENVCLYGDPDLRVWAPSTQYSTNNHWEKQDIAPFAYNTKEQFSIDGHMPFGVDEYTKARSPSLWSGQFLLISIAVVLIVIFVIGIIVLNRRKR